MVGCKKCQLKFAGSACPGCGAAPGLSTEKKVGFGIIIGIIIAAIVGAVSAPGRGSRQVTASPGRTAAAGARDGS